MKYLKQKFILSLMFIFILSISTCFAADNDATIPTPTSRVVINPSGDIPSYQVEYVSTAVQSTIDYMNANFNRTLDRNVTINIVNGDDSSSLFSSKEISSNIGGKSEADTINLIINSSSSEYYITFLTAHELIHQYQMNCYGSMKTLNKNLWFIEGMADVLGMEIASPINPAMDTKFRNVAKTNSLSYPIKLSDITDKQSWRQAFYSKEKTYVKADLAVLYLVDNYSPTLLFVYLNNLYNSSANNALKETYNIDIDTLENSIMGNNLADDYLNGF